MCEGREAMTYELVGLRTALGAARAANDLMRARVTELERARDAERARVLDAAAAMFERGIVFAEPSRFRVARLIRSMV